MTSYNAKDCVITWGSTYLTGLGEDMVSGEKDEEMFSTSVGAQGDVVVSEMNNDLGTVTVTLQATSPQRKQLIADAKSGAIKPLWVNNKVLGTSFGGTQARIKNYPELSLSQEAEDTEFEFQVFDYTVS